MNIQKDLENIYNKIWNEPNDKKELLKLLEIFYTERLPILSTATRKDILSSLFRIRNKEFQDKNCELLQTKILDYIRQNNIKFSWDLLIDSIDFCREPAKTILIKFLESWLINDTIFINQDSNTKWKYRLYACEYIYQSFDKSKIEYINNYLQNIITNNDFNYFVRSNALDTLYRSPNLFNINIFNLRNIIANIPVVIEQHLTALPATRQPKHEINIYNDSQNVHITEINEAIKDCIKNLAKDEEIRGNTIDIIIEKITNIAIEKMADCSKFNDNVSTDKTNNIIKIMDSLDRIKTDPAIFEIDNKKFKLANILVLVWNRIEKFLDNKYLQERLIEELIEASHTCATGHLSRIISSLVGYFSDIKQMNNYITQLKQCLNARINKKLKEEENKNDILENMIGDKILYNNFLNKYKQEFYIDLNNEFKSFITNFDIEFENIWNQL